MKKTISILLALCLTCFCGLTSLTIASSGTTPVNAVITADYTVTIPATIPLTYNDNSPAQYNITADIITPLIAYHRIVVNATGDGTSHAFSITDGTSAVTYKLSQTSTGAALTPGGIIATFTDSGSSPFWINVPSWTTAQSYGTYTGNIIFTIDTEFYVTPAIGGEFYSFVALKSNGTVWTWGSGTPTQVNGLTDVIAIAAGMYHVLALKSDGTVWMWGNIISLTKVSGLSNITAIAAGQYHSLALDANGNVWSWGTIDSPGTANPYNYNQYGALGDGTTIDRDTPMQVHGDANGTEQYLTDVTTIFAGQWNSFALKSDGTVWAWGYNEYGQLGNSTMNAPYYTTPIEVPALLGVTAVAGGTRHSLALKPDGTGLAWGGNDSGQAGNSNPDLTILDPTQVSGLTNVTAISAGMQHSVALKSNGTVWTWGSNSYGQLGNGTKDPTYVSGDPSTYATVNPNPYHVVGLANVTAIAAGGYVTIAMESDGSIWTWGENNYTSPTQVIFP
ncbi:MAG: hypothetical protein FWD71_21375 [Oscillospiraceae bacterium]|nr:hypothetical protein [Oscillospiraceae bacterium]